MPLPTSQNVQYLSEFSFFTLKVLVCVKTVKLLFEQCFPHNSHIDLLCAVYGQFVPTPRHIYVTKAIEEPPTANPILLTGCKN